MTTSYDYTPAQLVEALVKMQFPERTPLESAIIRDWLARHLHEYDRFSLSVRVGTGIAPDPTHLPGVQASAAFSTKKRIDILAWQGDQPFLFEVKQRLIPGALGQLLTYRNLWLKENPDARDPILGAIARTSDDDTTTALREHGVTVYLVPEAAGNGGSPSSGVLVGDTSTP